MQTVELKLKTVQSAADKARLTNVPGANKAPIKTAKKLTMARATRRIRRIKYLT
ncbi:MAG: hypothetical protein HC789_12610 [Microcoleus sp. CSU_2_2]|nr:hypothetical protein [Microcoleus sp. CSU_2_2]